MVRKIKTIILKLNTSIDTFFAMVDSDMSGAISPAELRKGLENYNVFLTQTDWSNLFSLLDADKSGEIDLKELKTLLLLEKTGKLEKQQLPEGDEEEKG